MRIRQEGESFFVVRDSWRMMIRNPILPLWIVPLLLCVSGCAPIAMWFDLREPEQVLRVQSLPPGYEPNTPQPPYTGPHPASLPFAASAFNFPVSSGEVGPIDHSLGPSQSGCVFLAN